MTKAVQEFHIHVDAKWISEEFDRFLQEQIGFQSKNFMNSPSHDDPYAPQRHLTLKLFDSEQFKRVFHEVEQTAASGRMMIGYIEGEYVAMDHRFAEKPYNPEVNLPFRLLTTTLPAGSFRESEIHLTLNESASDPRALHALEQMGLFSAHMQKDYGIARIFTTQGSREAIAMVLAKLIPHLDLAGGVTNATIKEERIARWWLSDPGFPLPPVIASIRDST